MPQQARNVLSYVVVMLKKIKTYWREKKTKLPKYAENKS